ncbi:Glucose/ribitol dehydrogenase [Penicillium sp. DV-2018c]|nr:Glucose/ribitol dehydrogenase [Penicillium sp. DV-2018c]
MFKPSIARHVTRPLHANRIFAVAARPATAFTRPFSRTSSPSKKHNGPAKDKVTGSPAKVPEGASAETEGQFARTDDSVQIEYPPDSEMPAQPVAQGRGGMHFKRTLAQFSLENKVSVVTGGARGLGLVMAQALVASGSDLAIIDLNTHYADVASPDSVNTAVAEVLAKHGQIDNLVTSAGFTENFEAINYPFDRMQKLWGVNVDGTYLFAISVAKHLMERKAPGSIVMIGSMSGSIVNVPQPQAPYNAAKAAVRHLAASLAVEWARHDIRVNCISPGYMLTALTRKILDENPQLRDHWTSLIPVGKMGTPEDLMGAVTFLLSDASKYITGADLRVDGGYTVT